MIDTKSLDQAVIEAVGKAQGIEDVIPFAEKDRSKVLAIEEEAEKKSLMGLGKVANTGVKDVVACDLVFVALTTMEFDWGCHASLVLKKGDEVVGEEVRDQEVIAKLSNQDDVWFMHQNFVIYKDRMSFPKDIMDRTCQFETPSLPAEWCLLDEASFKCHAIIYANPTPPCDLYLKERYFSGSSEKGLGTILIGVKL
jgi:hypothetical protein